MWFAWIVAHQQAIFSLNRPVFVVFPIQLVGIRVGLLVLWFILLSTFS
jgi:hypothetical protein